MPKGLSSTGGLTRCAWCGDDPLYVAYHDSEWGFPVRDETRLFEKISLEGFQSGLSWITILRKREAFRKAFDGFDPQKIARYTPKKVERLMGDAGIVRNRSKIESSIRSAHVYLEIEAKQGFSNYIWDFVDGRPVQNKLKHMGQMLTESDMSRKLSKDLKARGFNFCGPTIVYAFAQAVGMINDHLVDCHRHAECAALGLKGPA